MTVFIQYLIFLSEFFTTPRNAFGNKFCGTLQKPTETIISFLQTIYHLWYFKSYCSFCSSNRYLHVKNLSQ